MTTRLEDDLNVDPSTPSEDELKIEPTKADAASVEGQTWLTKSRVREILSSNPSHKSLFQSLFLLLEHENGEKGVVLAGKAPFTEDHEEISKLLSSTRLTEVSRNDVYGSYMAVVDPLLNSLLHFYSLKVLSEPGLGINMQLIFPANEKIIAKYRQEQKFVIRETPEDYETITKEWIVKHQLELTDPDEVNGFILAPDLKWNGTDLANLYVLAVVKRRGIKSIRDLTGEDIPLLENVRDKGLAAIREKYGIRQDQIRVYFHYQPSFYHLHMHFVTLSFDAPASQVLSAVALEDVISNIRIASDFYKGERAKNGKVVEEIECLLMTSVNVERATLSFTRKGSDQLLAMFRKAGRAAE